MLGLRSSLVCVLGVSWFFLLSCAYPQAPGNPPAARRAGFSGLPIVFEANRGQAGSNIDFIGRGQGYSAQLRSDHIILNLNRAKVRNSSHPDAPSSVIEISLAGANPKAKASGEDPLPGRSNYLFGSDPAGWITNVEQFGRVRYTGVYRRIDLAFHGNQGRVEHDFVVRPGADANVIRLGFKGAQRTEITRQGDLLLRIADGEVRMERPRAYQIIAGRQVEVRAGYTLHHGYASFRLGHYDPRRTLVIDPVLAYSTFFGGGGPVPVELQQWTNALAVDGSGNLYCVGETNSTSFPVTPGVVQPNPESTFISKLDPTGTSLIFATYIGGFSNPSGLALDGQGNVFVAGNGAAGLPIPTGSNPFQPNLKRIAVLKLNATGTAVLSATYLGGSGSDFFGGLVVDSAGDAYLTGSTNSNDFPVRNPLQAALGSSGTNAFVTKLNPSFSQLVYSTYLGGNSTVNTPNSEGIAVDGFGNAYVVGAASPGFPTSSGASQPSCPDSCSFMAELNPAGSSLVQSTYIGSGGGEGSAVAVDSSQNAYLAGLAPTFPLVNAIQPCASSATSPNKNFVAEFSQAGTLTFSTCLGLPGLGYPPVLTLDNSGNAYVAGGTQAGLPLQAPIDMNPPANSVARPFVSEIDHATHALLFSSYVAEQHSFNGGPPLGVSGDTIFGIAVDPNGNIYLAGQAGGEYPASLFPVFNARQPYFPVIDQCGLNCQLINGFIIKISPSAGAAAAVAPGGLFVPGSGAIYAQPVGTTSSPQVVTVYDLGTDTLTISNTTITGDFAIQSNNCGTVSASGGSCAIGVTFTPTQAGARTGALTITDSSAGSPHTVQLTGTGGAPEVVPSPTTLSYSSQSLGTTSAAQSITLTNPGAVGAQISRIQASGDFSETNDCGLSLVSMGSCTIQVTFTPTASGTRSGSVTVTNNAPDSPQSIALTGIGGAPSIGLSVAAGGTASATVTAGSPATYQLSIGGAGVSGTAALSCAGAPATVTCSFPGGTTPSFSATTASALTVNVTTQAPTMGSLRRANFSKLPWLWAAVLMGIVVLPNRQRAKSRSPRQLVLLALVAFLCSCGGGNGSQSNGTAGGTQPGTYNLNVVAQAGSATQSVALTLIVK